MADSYPYMINNGKIAQILDKIRKAAEPQRFTQQFLVNLGFGSTNDRGILPLLKKLGFLNEDGSPSDLYKDLRDVTSYRFVLGKQIRELYSEIYAINTEIHNASEQEIKGALSRVTGKEETSVNRYYATFKTLTDIAEFDTNIVAKEEVKTEEKKDIEVPDKPIKKHQEIKEVEHTNINEIFKEKAQPDFHYNIQIHLPATTDISVYNAIFKSIKDNLL